MRLELINQYQIDEYLKELESEDKADDTLERRNTEQKSD